MYKKNEEKGESDWQKKKKIKDENLTVTYKWNKWEKQLKRYSWLEGKEILEWTKVYYYYSWLIL